MIAFNYKGADAKTQIEEAKLTVAIAVEAEEAALKRAISIVRKRIKKPGTCEHPGKVASKKQHQINVMLEGIAAEIQSEINNDLPF